MQNVELFPKSEIDNIDAASAAISKLTTDLLDQYKAVEQVRGTIMSLNKTYSDFAGLEQRLAAIEKEAVKTHTEVVTVVQRKASGLRMLTQEEANARVATQAHNRELKLNAQEATATANSLNALTTRLSKLKIELKGIDVDSPQFKQMSKDVLDLNTKISTAEQSFGVFGRNVGNYNSVFSGVNFQVQQLARELPALAVSPQMFFLAISNNLPMLGDAIKMMKLYNAEQQAAGKASVSIGKTILGSIFSWQTIIVAAVTLLTLYGGEIVEWVGGLISASDALDDVAMKQKAINNLHVEAKKSTSDEITKLELLYSASQDISRSMDERKSAVDEMQRLYPDYLGNLSDEAILAGDALEAYDKLKDAIISKAMAEAAADKIAENEVKRLEELNELRENPAGSGFFGKVATAFSNEFLLSNKSISEANDALFSTKRKNDIIELNYKYDEQRKILEDLIDIRNLFDNDDPSKGLGGGNTEKNHRNRMSALNAERKAIEDLATAEIDMQMKLIRQKLAEDKYSHDERVSETNRLYDLEEERIVKLAEVQRANLIQRNIDENTTYNKDGSIATTIDKVEAAKNVFNQLLLLQLATDQAMVDSVDERNKNINELNDSATEDNIRAFEMQMQERARVIDQSESDELAELSAQYSGIFSNQEEYEEKRLAITRKYAVLREQAGLEALETQLAELKKDANITIAEEQKIADLESEIADYRVEINKEANDRMIEDDERMLEKKLENAQRIRDGLVELMNFMAEIQKINTDKQLDALDDEQKDAEDRSEEERDRIERLADAGAITEEQKNARIALSQQQLVEKQKEIDAQRAEIEKRQARYNVLLSTAQAIMKAAASGPWPWNLIPIGFAVANGIAQLAAVNAAKYAKGTPDGGHKGGLAWVGDGGRAEAVIYEGKAYRTPAIPTLIDLPKGAEVLPDWNDIVNSSIARDLITDPVAHVTNHYNTQVSDRYNDRGIRTMLSKQIEQNDMLIREIRRGRREERIYEFRHKKLKGIN